MREGRRDCAAPPSETLALSIVPTDSLSELVGRFLHLALGLVPCALSPVLGSLTHRILLLQTVLTSIPKEDVMRTSATPASTARAIQPCPVVSSLGRARSPRGTSGRCPRPSRARMQGTNSLGASPRSSNPRRTRSSERAW